MEKVVREIRKAGRLSVIGWVIQLGTLRKIKSKLPRKIGREIQAFHCYDLRKLRAVEKRLGR